MTRQGVLDLDAPNWKALVRRQYLYDKKPTVLKPEEPGPIYDLLYFKDAEIEKEILSLWPMATFEREYDFIHEWRTGVNIPHCLKFDWFRFLFREGIAGSSFCFQMVILEEPDYIEAVLDVENPGWRERTKKR